MHISSTSSSALPLTSSLDTSHALEWQVHASPLCSQARSRPPPPHPLVWSDQDQPKTGPDRTTGSLLGTILRPRGWITTPNSETHIASALSPLSLRRMRLSLVQNYTQGVNRTWLAQSKWTRILEELDLNHSSSMLFGRVWCLTQSAAHTLKALSIPIPHPTATQPSLDLPPMLNVPQLLYLRLWDRSNDMSLDSVIVVLEAVSPSLSLRRLVLDAIRLLDVDEDPYDILL
jgi:hypothetical protein